MPFPGNDVVFSYSSVETRVLSWIIRFKLTQFSFTSKMLAYKTHQLLLKVFEREGIISEGDIVACFWVIIKAYNPLDSSYKITASYLSKNIGGFNPEYILEGEKKVLDAVGWNIAILDTEVPPHIIEGF